MNFILPLFGFFLFGGSFSTFAAVVKHTFSVSYISGSPDGVYKTNILAINDQFPGPTIEAFVGDTIEVTLINKIQDHQNVTIHWHGLHQKGTLFEDGTAQIAQCPLPYGSFQVYRFPVVHPGTYWYHSHVNSQYTEGLLGALIVRSPKEHYQYDGELTLILHDWYHRSAHENEAWYLSPASGGLPPYPDAALINGFGRYPCNLASLQNRTCSIIHQKRPIYTVQQNATYRVRIINAGALAFFNFSIDGHLLETIEVDGVDVAKPVPVDVATIAPGQRYSFLVQPQTSSLENDHRFLIRSVVRKDLLRENSGSIENINKYPLGLLSEVTAVFQTVTREILTSNLVEESFEQFAYNEILPPPLYSHKKNRNDEEDDEDVHQIIYLDQMDLLPLDGIPAPDYFDHEFILSGGSATGEDGIVRAAFNGTPFHLPADKPLLFSLIDEGKVPDHAFPLEVDSGSVVQIVLNSRGSHPFHLHGHHFWVVGIGQQNDTGNYNPSRHPLNPQAMKRDAVVPHNWVVIRFIADNPGLWTLHCHLDWHNLSGMALTIVEGVDSLKETVRPTEEAMRICQLHR